MTCVLADDDLFQQLRVSSLFLVTSDGCGHRGLLGFA